MTKMTNLFSKKRNKKNDKKGFTLIELIIVIAILAILAAILVPSMVGYISEANQSVADTNARTVYSAAAAAAATLSAEPGSIVGFADKTVEEMKTGGVFQEKIGQLLGAAFTGDITVEVESSTIVSTTWSDGAGNSGTYEVPTTNP